MLVVNLALVIYKIRHSYLALSFSKTLIQGTHTKLLTKRSRFNWLEPASFLDLVLLILPDKSRQFPTDRKS